MIKITWKSTAYIDQLKEEGDKIVKEIAKLEIDITVLEKTDPTMVVAVKKLTDKSTRDITAQDMLANYRVEVVGHTTRLNAIMELMKKA